MLLSRPQRGGTVGGQCWSKVGFRLAGKGLELNCKPHKL